MENEAFDTVLGLVMIYSWIHGVIIICKKTENTTKYEKAVLIAGLVGITLFVLGSI